MKNKRYWLFGYHGFYPNGGFNDILNSFEFIDECKRCIARDMLSAKPIIGMFGYYNIVDTNTMSSVYLLDVDFDGLKVIKESKE